MANVLYPPTIKEVKLWDGEKLFCMEYWDFMRYLRDNSDCRVLEILGVRVTIEVFGKDKEIFRKSFDKLLVLDSYKLGVAGYIEIVPKDIVDLFYDFIEKHCIRRKYERK